TANFATAYQLTETVNGTGHGTVTPGSGGYYASGSMVTLDPTAATCSVLGGYSSNAPGGDVTFTGPEAVTITFNDNTSQLVGTLPASGSATGPVTFTYGGDRRVSGTNRWQRAYTLTNTGPALTNLYLALDPVTNVTSLYNAVGTTQCAAPLGDGYIQVASLAQGKSVLVLLDVVTANPAARWTANLRLLSGGKP
ncbi:MAG TPA: hypothetical protein VKG79_05845, partial [Bryobacteraceae bacterium]|nr:hypothetical protein [Bryobacteraceae bacterium]